MRLHFLTPIFTPIFTLLTCSNAAKQIPITPTPVEAPNLLLKSTIDNATIANSMVIPGGSPFFYLDDPKDNIFAVESIAMTPTPCVIGATCALLVTGHFTAPFPDGVDLAVDIELYLPDGQHARVIQFNGDVCEWAEVKQFSPGSNSQLPDAAHPPETAKRAADEVVDVCKAETKAVAEGKKTTLEVRTDLVQGFVLEATYYIDLKLVGEGKDLVHVGASVELKEMVPGVASTA